MADNLHTIPETVRFWGEEKPEAEVFTFINKHGRAGVYCPREILDLSSKFASLLLNKYGFSPGDVIANGLPNSPERLVTDMGILMAGCVMVNCQVLERDGTDLWNTARVAGSKGVILAVTELSAAYCLFQPLLEKSHSPHSGAATNQDFATVNIPQAPELSKVILVNRSSPESSSSSRESFLDRLRAIDNLPIVTATPKPDDLAVLFATSGSTGFCKLVPRTHTEILAAARSFEGAKDRRYFSDRPFGWIGGFPFDYIAYCSVRVLQDQFDGEHATSARDLWTVIQRENCTGAGIVPLMLEELVREFKDRKPDFVLPAIVTTGQPLREILCEALGLLTHAVVVAYSSTEGAMMTAAVITRQEDMTDFYAGKPIPGVQLKIVDDEGSQVATGTVGRVLAKTPRALQEYYNQPELTKEVFTGDGWLKTGDLGYVDDVGRFYCLGRAGDAVCQGSVVVFTSWPEGILAKCPSVHQVAVVAVTNSAHEQLLCACVVPRPGSGLTEESLMDFYKGSFFGNSSMKSNSTTKISGEASRSPSGFMIDLHKIVFLERLPEIQTGKVNKKELLTLAKEAIGA